MEQEKIDLDTYLRNLYFSLRTWHGIEDILETRDVQTVRNLCALTKRELLRVRNFGRHSLNEVLDELENYGLWLGMSEEELAEYEGKPLKKDEPQKVQEVDNINWEERRWGLVAQQLPTTRDYKHWGEYFDGAVYHADEWIRMYKEQLEKERKHNT